MKIIKHFHKQWYYNYIGNPTYIRWYVANDIENKIRNDSFVSFSHTYSKVKQELFKP